MLLPSLLLFIIIQFQSLSPALTLTPRGEWRLLHDSIGISAMHMQLLKNNMVVMFDRTDFGPSNLSLPDGRCRYDPNDKALVTDCTAHSILYDVRTNEFRALTVQTDTWCSSGAVLSNGTLVQTGGFNDGDHAIRTLAACSFGNCDWVEFPHVLAERRWYASNQILPDGRIIIVGGRAQFNYEFYPGNSKSIRLNFLRETRDGYENNLYPFLHLLPDGNLFIFANKRSIVFDYKQDRVVREFPSIPGGDSRNYPSSGSSVLLPIDENAVPVAAEVMICGGASHNAFQLASKGTFLRASTTCGRLRITDDQPSWRMEKMPMARVMNDMLLLPNGDVIIINGAGSGSAGWESARNPVMTPHIYKPGRTRKRFLIMAASPRARMYHSSALLLADGRVLVGGSNPHIYYNFSGVDFPTDLSLESFSPPYLSEQYDALRPRILRIEGEVRYNETFSLTFEVAEFLEVNAVSVRIMAAPFNTHSFSMNQRMVVLRSVEVSCVGSKVYKQKSVTEGRECNNIEFGVVDPFDGLSLLPCECMHRRPITSKMIGCNVSKLGGGGRANFQARLRPLLLQGLAGMRTWRLSARPSPAKDTPGLLLAEPEPRKSVAMATVIGSTYGIKVGSSKRPSLRLRVRSHTKHRHIARPKPKKLDADSDEDDEGRKISSSFPGSPSFRVFFLDAAGELDDGAGGNHDIVEEIVSSMSKETICVQKGERKKRANIKTVTSGKRREAMKKSLLNVKAFCHSPTLSAANTTKSGPS